MLEALALPPFQYPPGYAPPHPTHTPPGILSSVLRTSPPLLEDGRAYLYRAPGWGMSRQVHPPGGGRGPPSGPDITDKPPPGGVPNVRFDPGVFCAARATCLCILLIVCAHSGGTNWDKLAQFGKLLVTACPCGQKNPDFLLMEGKIFSPTYKRALQGERARSEQQARGESVGPWRPTQSRATYYLLIRGSRLTASAARRSRNWGFCIS